MRWLVGVLVVGCAQPDPIDVAWNRVFEVQSHTLSKGSCEPSTEASDPPRRFVAIGLGTTFDGVFNATTYWCPSAEECDTLPFSNAVLDTVTEQELFGTYVETAYDSRRLCQATWTGIEASLDGGGELTLLTQRHSTESTTQVTSDACHEFVESRIRTTCDETVVVRATAVAPR